MTRRVVLIVLLLWFIGSLAWIIAPLLNGKSLGLETRQFGSIVTTMKFRLPPDVGVDDPPLVLPDGFAADLAPEIERELARIPDVPLVLIANYSAVVREAFRAEFQSARNGMTHAYVRLPMVAENWIRIRGVRLERYRTHEEGPAAEANRVALRAAHRAIAAWIDRG